MLSPSWALQAMYHLCAPSMILVAGTLLSAILSILESGTHCKALAHIFKDRVMSYLEAALLASFWAAFMTRRLCLLSATTGLIALNCSIRPRSLRMYQISLLACILFVSAFGLVYSTGASVLCADSPDELYRWADKPQTVVSNVLLCSSAIIALKAFQQVTSITPASQQLHDSVPPSITKSREIEVKPKQAPKPFTSKRHASPTPLRCPPDRGKNLTGLARNAAATTVTRRAGSAMKVSTASTSATSNPKSSTVVSQSMVKPAIAAHAGVRPTAELTNHRALQSSASTIQSTVPSQTNPDTRLRPALSSQVASTQTQHLTQPATLYQRGHNQIDKQTQPIPSTKNSSIDTPATPDTKERCQDEPQTTTAHSPDLALASNEIEAEDDFIVSGDVRRALELKRQRFSQRQLSPVDAERSHARSAVEDAHQAASNSSACVASTAPLRSRRGGRSPRQNEMSLKENRCLKNQCTKTAIKVLGQALEQPQASNVLRTAGQDISQICETRQQPVFASKCEIFTDPEFEVPSVSDLNSLCSFVERTHGEELRRLQLQLQALRSVHSSWTAGDEALNTFLDMDGVPFEETSAATNLQARLRD